MDYGRPDRADALAAEYVTGTLRGGARRRFQSLLPAHPSLQRAVSQWQDRLLPLTSTITPVAPPARVWQRIEEQLDGRRAPAVSATPIKDRIDRWRSLALWRSVAGLATVAAIALAVVVANPPPSLPPILVVLSTPATAGSPASPSLVASVSSDGRALVTRPIVPVSLQPDRALQLWALPTQGAPRSLGLISADGTTALPGSRIQSDVTALAVSVEPPGGSPTGQPTGPVILTGALRS